LSWYEISFFSLIPSVFFHVEDRSRMQHSHGKGYHDIELKQLDRLDNTWRNLRENENRLIQRNVPRLMIFNNDCKFI
jgi:hypothetical protein